MSSEEQNRICGNCGWENGIRANMCMACYTFFIKQCKKCGRWFSNQFNYCTQDGTKL